MQPTPEQETVFLTALLTIGPVRADAKAWAYIGRFDAMWTQAFGRVSTLDEWSMFTDWCESHETNT